MKICILIPVHNEGKTIAQLVRQVKEKGFDIVVVDDGSTDHSGQIAQDNGAKVIFHQSRNGKGQSLHRGFECILKSDYTALITMDGDGQHHPDDIDHIVEKAKNLPKSIVTGNRMSNKKDMPLVRYFTNRFMSALISFVCRQRIPDTQCGFRYIDCDILRSLNLICKDYEIESEVLIKAAKKGYPIYSVPVKTIYDDEASHINPLRDTVKFFVYIIKEIFNKTG